MYSPDELTGLFDFLRATNEGNLKKMLCSGKMTEVHLRTAASQAKLISFIDMITTEQIPRKRSTLLRT